MILNFWTVLCVVVCVGVSEAMKEGDVGVCPVLKNVRKTRIETVTKKVPCWKGQKPPTCHKTVNQQKAYFEKEPGLACCGEYEWVKATDSCKPLCTSGCDGGSCVAPNNCHCEAPLILDKNKCVPPMCDHPCVNGHCTAPNTCTCSDGYLLKEDNFTCSAQCTNCENGGCTTPNVCECNEGFLMIENQCKPVCKSECSNGFCVSPDVCSCNDGYELKNNTCMPICGVACVNGNCAKPNTCECLTGFEPKDASKEVCEPKCDSCNNGECVAPNKCRCHKGYSLIDNICTPICEDKCVNAICEAPDTCVCLTGFEHKLGHEAVCMPKCDSCANGECVSPNKCVCNKGYERIDNVCTPTCKDKCVNANCVEPNTCKCLTGFEPKLGHEAVCEPKCDSCSNGNCVAPNKCTCHKGYSLIDNICTPTCKDKCVNANCVAPDTCLCLTGFKPKLGHEAVCMPKCDSCANGECVRPNKCVCHKGYERIDNLCRPTCTDACVNGNCTAPNVCTCKEGYTRNATQPSICHKPCRGCSMGTCTLDGECTCDADSKLTNGTCLALARIEASGMEATSAGLASLEMSWVVGGAVGVLLVVLVVVVINRMWRRRKDFGPKATDDANNYGSVIYTLPDTLIRNSEGPPTHDDDINEADEGNESDDEDSSEKLMATPNGIV